MICKHGDPPLIQEHDRTLCQIRLIPQHAIYVPVAPYSVAKGRTEESTIYHYLPLLCRHSIPESDT